MALDDAVERIDEGTFDTCVVVRRSDRRRAVAGAARRADLRPLRPLRTVPVTG